MNKPTVSTRFNPYPPAGGAESGNSLFIDDLDASPKSAPPATEPAAIPQSVYRRTINWQAPVSLMYAINRVVCFALSAMVSFIFYSSLAGSNEFFYWFNGLVGVAFDIKRVQLWGDGKKVLASLFIAFAVFAFAGSSIMETQRASIRTQDAETIASLKNNIIEQNALIEQQKKRMADTSNDVAPVKEGQLLAGFVAQRDKYQTQLDSYKAINTSDASMTSFQIIADKINMDVVVLVWIFFILRAVLLEVSVLYSSAPMVATKNPEENKTPGQAESFTAFSPDINKPLGIEVHKWMAGWIKGASENNRGGALDRLISANGYIAKLESIANKEGLYVKQESGSDPNEGNAIGVRLNDTRRILLRRRIKGFGGKIKSAIEKKIRRHIPADAPKA